MFKNPDSTQGDDITVIPLTSAARNKQADKFDIFVTKDETNKLFQNSYARVRQVRAVSLKRLGKCIGTITDPKAQQEINEAALLMFGLSQ